MVLRRFVAILGSLMFISSLLSVQASDAFRVENIRVLGLQRIAEGTVFNYLPIKIGDRLTPQRSQSALRELYKTGFFQDVSLAREGSTLLVSVRERPAIAKLNLDGNKGVSDDELLKTMDAVGLAVGQVFSRPVLDQVQQELRRAYFSNGKYSVKVESEVRDVPGNQVEIDINIREGRTAEIRHINIVGNKVFSEEVLLDNFDLQSSDDTWFWGSEDQYSRFKLSGDLEKLGSYYQDRGYINFQIESVQVSVSPDKEGVFITANVNEGARFTISSVDITGDTVVDVNKLKRLTVLRRGQVFSRKLVTASSDNIKALYANQGYAFAKVNMVPDINQDSSTVGLTLVVDPGKRTYIRRVVFVGNARTNDEVLRREMRQFEGGWYSQAAIERSRTRVARLSYIEDVQVENLPVPGSDDQVDLEFTVVERAPGSVQLGVGFSGSSGFLINSSVTNANFLGTGKRVSVDLNRNQFTDSASVSYTDPYWTDAGVSQTISAFFRRTEGVTLSSSSFTSNAFGASLGYTFPITEFDALRLGTQYRNTEITSVGSAEVRSFVSSLSRGNVEGARFDSFALTGGWIRDTRDRTVFATKGGRHRFLVELGIPGTDIEYYSATYRYTQFIPITGKWKLRTNLSLGYADSFSEDHDLPPFETFFAGGIGSVRGYESNSLGPRDSNNNPYGGDLLTVAQLELIVPTPLPSDGKSTRFSIFFDSGNVFGDLPNVDGISGGSATNRRELDFGFSELRSSVGVSVEWLTPLIGLLRFSLSYPINDEPGDETEVFQFSFGTVF